MSSVTTVSSTGLFLAPRSARRSDASDAAGRSAGGSLWRQREPGRKRRPRVQTTATHAQPGWHRHLAPRSARRSDASDAAGLSAGGSRRRQRPPSRLRRPRVQTPAAHAQPGWHRRLAARCARRSDASNAAGRSAGGSLRRQRPPARLRRPRVQTQPGRGRSRRSLRRTHARARAAALVSSCVGATRRRSRARPPAAPTLGRGRPNSSFGVRARRRGWASTLRAGERLTTLTSPPLEQNVRARAPPRALPASHFADGRRMAAKAPRGAMEIL